MAGKTNFTTSIDDRYMFSPLRAQAFCEGMVYRAGGTLLGRPNTDNPYPADPELGYRLAWLEGWLQAENAEGITPIGDGHAGVANCALDPGTIVSP